MTRKSFLSIENQIELLHNRGLIIKEHYDIAYDFLYENNYYRVSGYTLTLRKNDKFYDGVTILDVIQIYNFDHELRQIILNFLEIIETNVKSVYAYEFAKKYGPYAYLDDRIFTNKNTYDKIIKKAEKQKNTNIHHEAYIKHHVNDLKDDMPIWAYVDLFTIANASLFIKISEDDLKTTVANAFGIKASIAHELIGQLMHSMTILRNFCAHGSRLYNRVFEQKPSLRPSEKKLLIIDKNGIIDNSHLYGFIFLMKRLLKKDDFSILKNEIINLTEKFPFVDMKHYGFRDDWKVKL